MLSQQGQPGRCLIPTCAIAMKRWVAACVAACTRSLLPLATALTRSCCMLCGSMCMLLKTLWPT